VTALETDARRVSIEIGVRSRSKRRGWQLLPSVAFALWAAMAGTPRADAEPDATRSAVNQARSLGLAATVEWKRLVHYRTGSWGGLVSDIDDPRFFLSPRGKEAPDEELEATLRAFFAPIREGREDEHALCRFPARRRWLDERLHFEGPMRSPRCPALSRFRAAVDPDSVALVYASNYLGNPGSALGHTFLRIRKRRLPGQTASRERLDFGVEYVAATDTSNPFLYAFKGLSGMFPGRVEFRSFEYKMREYGTLQDRDLWEYGLALTPGERDLLVLHLWEVSNARTDYYYLSQNCAYHILAVLEAAAPRIDVVSVSSQRDVEQADLATERRELTESPEGERDELMQIYVKKGLSEALARQVAHALMASGDPLAVHAREELKLDPNDLVRPVQAALVSAVSFAGGAALPLAIIVLCPAALRVPFTLTAALSALALLGGLSAKLGRVPIARVLVRVIAGGLLAMGLTYGLGTLFGAGG
jgi:VIT1/CCC1 family predicted Fe2+/Mn2+ transporter